MLALRRTCSFTCLGSKLGAGALRALRPRGSPLSTRGQDEGDAGKGMRRQARHGEVQSSLTCILSKLSDWDMSGVMVQTLHRSCLVLSSHAARLNVEGMNLCTSRDPSLQATRVLHPTSCILQSPVYGISTNNSRSLSVFGVPNPVTGSHPGTAWKPGVPQPWFPPDVMSLKTYG